MIIDNYESSLAKFAYKLLLLSQRNAIHTDISLLRQTECKSLLFSSEMGPVIKGVESAMQTLECLHVPSLEEMLEARTEDFPYSEEFDEARRNPIVILHSSGSTGRPLLISP